MQKFFGATLIVIGVLVLFATAGTSDLYVEQLRAGMITPGPDTWWNEVAGMTAGVVIAGIGILFYLRGE
ncbi:MAG: hypothetical protein AAB727_00270 [Patescibacteria group bacterium]